MIHSPRNSRSRQSTSPNSWTRRTVRIGAAVPTSFSSARNLELPLAEEIAAWAQSESAAQARLWLGKWHAGRKEWAPAVEAFAGLTRESLHFPAAVVSIAPCWQEHLRSLAAAGKKTDDEAERAAA